jgi:formylglycine-generating enzyme required for sulfatase activity
MMGDENNGPVHEVTLTTVFLMQTTPVTQKQWESVSHIRRCANEFAPTGRPVFG